MPKLTRRLTDALARTLPAPDTPTAQPSSGGRPRTEYEIHWCKDTPGFGVRVTSAGVRSWVFERRVEGKTKRRTLGAVTGRAAISAEEARKLAVQLSADLQRGDDPLKLKAAQAKEARASITLAEAVREYVDGKRRAKDGKGLKQRTKDQYVAAVTGDRVSSWKPLAGMPLADGMLYPLANKPLNRISADDIREVHAQNMKRGARQAAIAMQILRAVINWHAVQVPGGNPFSKAVPGRERIVLPQAGGNPRPVPPERLGAFWRSVTTLPDRNPRVAESAHYIQFVLLTGVRGSESAGSEYNDGILVGHVDLEGGRIEMPDTKNRQDHTLYLSRQALELVRQQVKGKKASQRLWSVQDPGKTLAIVCKEAGIEYRSLHEVRKTFASVAEELVSGYTLKRMLNHAQAGDVTGEHYVGKSESQLRRGWQTVADFIEEQPAALPEVAMQRAA